MRLTSVNVGKPREHLWDGKTITTGIFKDPVSGPVVVRRLQIEGDGQADLTVHGGRDMAVYAYPAEHYGFWSRELNGRSLPWGIFGENLTTEGLLEDQVCIGDTFQIGSARLVVVQPRMPCFKLSLRFNDTSMVKRFTVNGRPGIYFRVDAEGEIAPGDPISCIHKDENRVTVTEVFRLVLDKSAPIEDLNRALQVPALGDTSRKEFVKRIEALKTAPVS